jgi:hypothetical protein
MSANAQAEPLACQFFSYTNQQLAEAIFDYSLSVF